MGKQSDLNKCLEVAAALYAPSERKGRHFAFLLDNKGNIISIGQNNKTMHPIQHYYGYPGFSGEHAEFAALRKLNFKLKQGHRYKLVSIRIDRNKKLNYAAPCKCCSNLLRVYGIDEVTYTDWSGEFVESKVVNIPDRTKKHLAHGK